MELPYDSAIPLLDVYPKESKSAYSGDTCTPMFIVALFTIVKYGISLDAHQWMNV
jgi:hypothetical protein